MLTLNWKSKRKYILLLLVFFTISLTCRLNAQVVIWADSCQANTFNGNIQTASPGGLSEITKILNYPGGDLICIGRIRTHPADAIDGDVGLVMRISAAGAVIWSRFVSYIGLTGYYDMYVHEAMITSTGDIVISTDYNLMKLDGNGNEVWQKKIPTMQFNPSFQQLIETADGGILAAGVTVQTAIINKFDAQGTMLWSKLYQNALVGLQGIVEVNGSFYFIAKGWDGISSNTYSYNILGKLNSSDGLISWIKKLGTTSSNFRTEYTYDKIQSVNNNLVISGFTNYDYTGPNAASQSIVTLSLAGDILEAKKILQNDFVTDRTLLFKKKRYDAAHKIGVQYSYFENGAFCIYKRGQQNNIDWAIKYPVAPRMIMNDMEITADSGIAVTGYSEAYTPYNFHAFLIKTSLTGNLSGCPGSPIQVQVSDDNISVRDTTLFASVNSPTNVTVLTLLNTPGTNFNFVLTCTGQTAAKLGKITGPQAICTGTTNTYYARRNGSNIQPIQYSIAPATAGVVTLSDSSVSVNFTSPGRYVLYASMVSACKILKDSLIIDVYSSPGVLNLGPDIALCTQNSILLNARSGYSTYRWQDGSTDSVFMVNGPGQYYVDVSSVCGSVYTDTVNVTKETVIFVPVNNRIKCNADTVQLVGPGGFYNYRWVQQGASLISTVQNPVLNPAVTTTYFFSAEKRPGCLIFDTATVVVLNSPAIDLGRDTGFCKTADVALNAGNDYPVYTWNTGANSNTILVDTAGAYWVFAVHANGCIARDTVQVIEYPLPVVSLGNDTLLCINVPRMLATTNSFTSYLWQDGATVSKYDVKLPGNYSVKVTDKNGCNGTAAIKLTLSDCIKGMFMPLAFTPDNNGLNDRIKPIIKGNLVTYRFLIMNRYGEKIFESTDPQSGWNGTFKQLAQPAGTYVWYCEYQFSGQNKWTENGSLILIR